MARRGGSFINNRAMSHADQTSMLKSASLEGSQSQSGSRLLDHNHQVRISSSECLRLLFRIRPNMIEVAFKRNVKRKHLTRVLPYKFELMYSLYLRLTCLGKNGSTTSNYPKLRWCSRKSNIIILCKWCIYLFSP